MKFKIKYLFVCLFALPVNSAQTQDYFQQKVDYDITVKLDDDNHTLSAYEKIIYTNNSPDELSFIWFHIWPNAYKNDSTAYAKQAGPNSRFASSDSLSRGFIDSLDFSVDGKKVDWSYHPDWIDVVKLNLEKPLKSGKTIIIETPFFVKLPKVFSRLGHSGKHYEITQWYPKPAVYDRKGWHPMPYLNQGEFYSEFGTFNVKITLPKDYKIMATGDLINGEEEYNWLDSFTSVTDSLNRLPEKELKKWIKGQKNNKENSSDDSLETVYKTLHFRQNKVHDFAWFADKKWLVQKGELALPNTSKKVTLWSFYLPKNAETWRKSIEYLHDSGYWFSRYYGDYPYNHITAVDGDLSAGGGMEYPNITVIASMPSKHLLEMVIMHEVGHNWFYGIIGSNERYHTWMDEGLNEYSAIRYWQDKYKDDKERFVLIPLIQNKLKIAKDLKFSWFEYFQYSSSAKNQNAQPLNLKAEEYKGSNYGQNYSKTAVFTRFLQHYLGEEKMDEIMQDYYERWKFKHPYPEDFQNIVENHTDKDLNWYFDGVFNTIDYVDYSINKDRQQFIISNHGDLKTPVEIVFFGDNHKILERRWLEDIHWRKTIRGPEGTWYAIIDPDEHMPDVKRENNSTRKELHFNWVWNQPNYFDNEINILPWLFSYNYYNGWTPGALLYKGLTPGYSSTSTFQPMWDFNNNQPAAKIIHRKNFETNNYFRESSLTISGMKHQGNTGGFIKFNGGFGREKSKNNILIGMNYSKLESGAFDTLLYSLGSVTTFSFDYQLNRKLDGILNTSSFNTGIIGSKGFAKIWADTKINFQFNEKLNTEIRFWAGNFINNTNPPRQFRTYLSGGVDPNFTSYVYDRTGKSSVAILQNQYINQGPGLRGYLTNKDGTPISTMKSSWGINVSSKLPFFIDIVGGKEFENTYSAAGVQFGPLILPLYQSWELDSKSAKDLNWVKNRMRISFSANINFFGL